MRAVTEDPKELDAQLNRWTAAGLISAQEAAGIARWESLNSRGTAPSEGSPGAGRAESAARRRSVAVEALAYLGGAVILAALVLVTLTYWPGLSRLARMAIPFAATTILLLAGAVVPHRLGPLAARLRGVLWLLSSATLGVLLIVATDVPSLTGPSAFLVVAGSLTVATLTLWLLHRSAAQQLAAFVALEMFAVAIADEVSHQGAAFEGGSMAAVALLWGAAAWYGLLPGVPGVQPSDGHRASGRQPDDDAERHLALALAAVGASVGGVILAAQQDVPWLGAIPVVFVVCAAILMTDLLVLGIGAVGTLVILPMVVSAYVESVLSTALVLLATGAMLVAVAVWVARRRRKP